MNNKLNEMVDKWYPIISTKRMSESEQSYMIEDIVTHDIDVEEFYKELLNKNTKEILGDLN